MSVVKVLTSPTHSILSSNYRRRLTLCGSTPMPIDRKLLEILCCPVTKHPVTPLSPDQLERVNAAIADGQVNTFEGTLVDTGLSEGLITTNGTRIYRVEDDIPIMLETESIPADQIDGL